MDPLKILFVSGEISPYGSTGGLSEVAEALPQALMHKGVQIYRVMPKYAGIEKRYPLKRRTHFIVDIGGKPKEAVVYSHKMDGIITLFIENKEYFGRFTYYGFDDDHLRYGFFCKAVLQMMMVLNLQPDILHLNDWQTALISLLI